MVKRREKGVEERQMSDAERVKIENWNRGETERERDR